MQHDPVLTLAFLVVFLIGLAFALRVGYLILTGKFMSSLIETRKALWGK